MFVCGPLHGEQFFELHTRFAALRRIAVGVSVINPADPACAGFALVLARDGAAAAPVRDLASLVHPVIPPQVPVVGVALAAGQGEYGARRRHEEVTGRLTHWGAARRAPPVVLETRLDTRDWRLCSTADAFQALLSRLDIVVTTRLHGLVLALQGRHPGSGGGPGGRRGQSHRPGGGLGLARLPDRRGDRRARTPGRAVGLVPVDGWTAGGGPPGWPATGRDGPRTAYR